jgi:hypothetical protein
LNPKKEIGDEHSKSQELEGKVEVVQNKKRKIEAIMCRMNRSMKKGLTTKKHDIIQF